MRCERHESTSSSLEGIVVIAEFVSLVEKRQNSSNSVCDINAVTIVIINVCIFLQL